MDMMAGQTTTEQKNPMEDMQKWLAILGMMKKNKIGFWSDTKGVAPQTIGGLAGVKNAKGFFGI